LICRGNLPALVVVDASREAAVDEGSLQGLAVGVEQILRGVLVGIGRGDKPPRPVSISQLFITGWF
jgi:hypothetical protein